MTGLWLYGASPAAVGTSSATMTAETFNVVLEARATGVSRQHGLYEIGAGRARFVVGATGAGTGTSLRATNTSAISLRENGAGWSVLPFSIGYVDAGGKTWDLTVSQTTWSFVQ